MDRAAIVHAYTRAGCRVYPGDDVDETGAPIVRADCGDGWGAARTLVALADKDHQDPTIRGLAAHLRKGTPGPEAYARRVFALVSGLEFRREQGETFQGPAVTLERGYGDCDCQARLAVALLRAAKVPARFGFLHPKGGQPRHVYAEAFVGRRWQPLETTVRGATFGESPLGAAKRAGLVRDDIDGFSEVTTMGSFGVVGGRSYNIELGCLVARDELPDRPEECVRRALESAGFRVQEVIDQRPADWPQVAQLSAPMWPAWAAAMYAEPVCAQIGDIIGDSETARFVLLQVNELPQHMGDAAPSAAVNVVHTRDLSDSFFVQLKALATRLGTKPERLLAVMASESGIRACPACASGKPPGTNKWASGIIQIANLAGVGFPGSRAEFESLPAVAQLPYVERYYEGAPKAIFGDSANIYQYNFLPASIARGLGQDVVIVASNGTGYGGKEAQWYRDNKVLDKDGNGVITVGDLKRQLQNAQMSARWLEALARLRAAPDAPSMPPALVGGILCLASLVVYAYGTT